MLFVVNPLASEERAPESAKLERARRDARTSWAGLLEGHRLEKIAGKAGCSGRRKEGPPNDILA